MIFNNWHHNCCHHRQAPEEILERESTLTARLKEAARVERRGGSAEKQEWEEGRRFGGRIVVEKKEEALRTAKERDDRTRCGRTGLDRRMVRWERRASGGPQRGGGPDAATGRAPRGRLPEG